MSKNYFTTSLTSSFYLEILSNLNSISQDILFGTEYLVKCISEIKMFSQSHQTDVR